MRIHTNDLTEADILTAALHAGVIVHGLTEHRSRSRNRAWNLYLEGSGYYGGQWGTISVKSATWDEWGIFLARLYTKDATMHTGCYGYQDAEHFHWCTGGRFMTLAPRDQHRRHRWEYQGIAVGSRYHVAKCSKCPAIKRWLSPGVRWEEFRA